MPELFKEKQVMVFAVLLLVLDFDFALIFIDAVGWMTGRTSGL